MDSNAAEFTVVLSNMRRHAAEVLYYAADFAGNTRMKLVSVVSFMDLIDDLEDGSHESEKRDVRHDLRYHMQGVNPILFSIITIPLIDIEIEFEKKN